MAEGSCDVWSTVVNLGSTIGMTAAISGYT